MYTWKIDEGTVKSIGRLLVISAVFSNSREEMNSGEVSIAMFSAVIVPAISHPPSFHTCYNSNNNIY